MTRPGPTQTFSTSDDDVDDTVCICREQVYHQPRAACTRRTSLTPFLSASPAASVPIGSRRLRGAVVDGPDTEKNEQGGKTTGSGGFLWGGF